MNEMEKQSYVFRYRRFERGDVKLKWHLGYYDGPVSGILMCEGKMCWFDECDEWLNHEALVDALHANEDDCDPPWSRRFLIYELSDEEYELERRKHALFQRIGFHSDYDEEGRRVSSDAHRFSNEAWDAMCSESDALPKRPNYVSEHHRILGWFES